MKCCVCGSELEGFGNNPYPLCDKEDNSSRCCDVCNEFVVRARISSSIKNTKIDNVNIGDTIVIFYSKNSDHPTISIKDTGKFMAGIVSDIKKIDKKIELFGSWGNYSIGSEDNIVNLQS